MFEEWYVSQGVILGAIGWLLKIAYDKNRCFARIEQKLDDLKNDYEQHKNDKYGL